jgi:hypothetical protein
MSTPCHICIYWTPENGCEHFGPAKPEPEIMFFKRDLSGRDGSYPISLDDIFEDDEENEDDQEFIDWVASSEVGDEYHGFNNRTYTRTS